MSRHFKTIGLIGKFANQELGEHLEKIRDYLQAQKRIVVLDAGTAEVLPIDGLEVKSRDQIGEICDLVIVIGGDGTMLNTARSLAQYGVPLVGINMGHLGFLTDIPWEGMEECLDGILSGHFRMEERILLDSSIIREGAQISHNIAFNDVVVHKWEEARMLEFETTIDGQFVNSQRSDGLIISTPTGSTAYALSGGGPIMHPSLEAITLVPICPHTLSQRPLAIPGNSVVEIAISESGHGSAQVTCDGQINMGVLPGDKIRIKRFEKTIKLLHPNVYNYYEILRLKLHWGEKL